jgi:Cft2 family RNA processing exonuclease
VTEPLAPFLVSRPEGLHAPALDAWIDPAAACPRAILTHAHADHAAAGHGEVWATAETIGLYRRRNPGWSGAARTLAYGEPVSAGGMELTLLPAGHVLGSAQLRLESAAAGSLLYTGDFKLRASRTAGAASARPSDLLVTETTFGLPVFRFPGREELESRLVEACREALAAGETPVVLAWALGKAQEAIAVLTEARLPTVLHGAAWKLLPEFEAAGLAFPMSRPYESAPPREGEVLIAPPSCSRTEMVRRIKRRRVIYLSGWALREASRPERDADVLIPWSDHADFDDLLRHVDAIAPRRVFTFHGFASDFAAILESRGVPAEPLAGFEERAPEGGDEERAPEGRDEERAPRDLDESRGPAGDA